MGLILILFSIWPDIFPDSFSEDAFEEDDVTKGMRKAPLMGVLALSSCINVYSTHLVSLNLIFRPIDGETETVQNGGHVKWVFTTPFSELIDAIRWTHICNTGGEIEDIASLAHQFIDVPVCVGEKCAKNVARCI